MVSKILTRIESILDRINIHPEYSGCVRKERIEAFRLDSARHSFDLEERSEQDAGIKPSRGSKIYLQRIVDGWDYLAKYGIDVSSLSSLGNILEPDLKSPGFRKVDVNLGIPKSEVPFAMENLVANINDVNRLPSILRAIDAHIELVRIHPYADGNGRAARLLQNFCLEQRGYPSAIISGTEKDLYLKLLRDTLNTRFKDGSTAASPTYIEQNFHEFIYSKILSATEALESELKTRRIYDVIIERYNNPGVLESIKRNLRVLGRRDDKRGVSVESPKSEHFRKKNTSYLQIVGDIGLDEVSRVLDQATEKYGVYSSVRVHRGCK